MRITFIDEYRSFVGEAYRACAVAGKFEAQSDSLLDKNISNAAIFMVLYSLFEEYVRVILKEYVRKSVGINCSINCSFKDVYTSHLDVVSAKIKKLKSLKEPTSRDDLVSVSKNLLVAAFRPEKTCLYLDDICSNNYNIDAEVLKEMCKKVGIKEIIKKISLVQHVQYFYNASSSDVVGELLVSDLLRYKQQRNSMIHSCGFRSGFGFADVLNYHKFIKRFLLCFAIALQHVLDSSIPIHR